MKAIYSRKRRYINEMYGTHDEKRLMFRDLVAEALEQFIVNLAFGIRCGEERERGISIFGFVGPVQSRLASIVERAKIVNEYVI